jgi:proline dehydrogenase
MDLNPLYRRVVLTVAGNRAVSAAAQRYGLKVGASRFIAGETLADALAAVRDLNRRGIGATLDYLGEGVHEEAVAREMCRAYLEMLDGIAASGVRSNASLKLTQMGLTFSKELALENVEAIVRRAAGYGNFVRIDMEDTLYTDDTLEIYQALRRNGFDNVGVVIQAYLYRSERDIEALGQVNTNIRLVKGAYKEPPHLAYPRIREVDENFRKLIRARLLGGFYTAVATHDEQIIEYTRSLVAEHRIPADRFEFQMLYGVRTGLQEELARLGYTVRCYVPYGRQWYPYFTRRIAERPGNLFFVLRNLLKP